MTVCFYEHANGRVVQRMIKLNCYCTSLYITAFILQVLAVCLKQYNFTVVLPCHHLLVSSPFSTDCYRTSLAHNSLQQHQKQQDIYRPTSLTPLFITTVVATKTIHQKRTTTSTDTQQHHHVIQYYFKVQNSNEKQHRQHYTTSVNGKLLSRYSQRNTPGTFCLVITELTLTAVAWEVLNGCVRAYYFQWYQQTIMLNLGVV